MFIAKDHKTGEIWEFDNLKDLYRVMLSRGRIVIGPSVATSYDYSMIEVCNDVDTEILYFIWVSCCSIAVTRVSDGAECVWNRIFMRKGDNF